MKGNIRLNSFGCLLVLRLVGFFWYECVEHNVPINGLLQDWGGGGQPQGNLMFSGFQK